MGPAMSGPSLVEEAARRFVEYRRTSRIDALVRLLTPTLWHLARSCGLERADAEDVVQTAWLRLVDKAESIRAPEAVLGWLGTTVRREAWRISKERSRAIPDEDPPEPEDFTLDPAALAAMSETKRALLRHLAELSPRCRAILRVISRGGPPDYAVLAETLGVPVGSIGPTRGRCLAKLRASLTSDPTWSRA